MTRLRLLTAAVLLGLAAPGAQAADERVELRTHPRIGGLRLADVNGDGLADLLLAEGRGLHVFHGRRGRLPAPEPNWATRLDAGVSFVDVLPPAGGKPGALLLLGTAGLQRLPLAQDAAAEPLPGGDPLSWRDADEVSFARLVQQGGGLLLPGRGGWTWRPAGGAAIHLEAAPLRSVRPPGPFLEDTCAVTVALPPVFVGAPAQEGAGGGVALWTLTGRGLLAHGAEGQVAYDLGFLRTESAQQDIEQRLVDLDGDRRPELVHRIANNREARYGFFRTRPAPKSGGAGPSHQPAAGDVYLSGFPLPPEVVDLDGDGFPDLVLTSIQIDAANTLRALSSGQVTAETHAFLNRWDEGGGRYFRDEADAAVKSDIGVEVRFNYAGVIEVERSFTILVAGDYDGDGRKDLAIRTGGDALTVRRGVAVGVWEERGRAVPIPALGPHPDVDGFTGDLDGDGRDEVVLRYHAPVGGRDRVWIVRLSP